MPVARHGLDRNAGWLPKSSCFFPQLKPLCHACFPHSAPRDPRWGCSASVVCFSGPPHNNTTADADEGSKITPTPNKQLTLGLSETSGSGWLQLSLHAHTRATIRLRPDVEIISRKVQMFLFLSPRRSRMLSDYYISSVCTARRLGSVLWHKPPACGLSLFSRLICFWKTVQKCWILPNGSMSLNH